MKRIIAILACLLCGPALALQDSQIPAKFPIPWANSAGGAYVRAIPTASQITIQNCAASLTDGFPPNAFNATSGCGPFGQDFNGILKQLSQWAQWYSVGGPIGYDSAISAAVGGYPNGSCVQSLTIVGRVWCSTVDNNTSNPDTGGAGWTNAQAVGGVLTGTLPNPGMASGAAAANVGALGGSLTGSLPNPGIAASGVTPGTYPKATVTVGTDGRITFIQSTNIVPTYQSFVSGTAQTYTTPAGVQYLKIKISAGGGGGGGSSNGSPAGTGGGTGGTATFGSTTAIGGLGGGVNSGVTPGSQGNGGTGGTTGTGTQILRLQGGFGGSGTVAGASTSDPNGGAGGGNPFGGAPGSVAGTGLAGAPNTGAGGAGAAGNTNQGGGGGGGAGEYVEFIISSPAATYTYTVGAAGTAGTGNIRNAAPGSAGIILVEENY